jgi:hypothetical protein
MGDSAGVTCLYFPAPATNTTIAQSIAAAGTAKPTDHDTASWIQTTTVTASSEPTLTKR